ncbi:peroxiredoxin-like family protein [Halopseudomonas sabulinigri]|uniref:Peroxiredoxin n=1 Tax=Halopseudomonas sabulinigri TaxID=472181 RepID=A0A1H1LFT3_9GAMM|nr:peroxiredoxin-like family protein [Halopseudomonas sabulinigri]SDR73376.1 Peroxiredoxin [Halopseudomonas sabulinigri]
MTQQAKVGLRLPSVTVKTLDNQTIQLGQQNSATWQLVVVYRGLHCPICKSYLSQIEAMKSEFEEINVKVIAISTDPEEKAKKFRDECNLSMTIGYGLSISEARTLGLFISEPMSSAETDQPFAEPGTFLIRPDRKLHIMDVSNAPFSRPDLKMLKSGIAFIQKKDYPIRGTA